MKTWNFGIVGAGLIADFHANAVKAMPAAKLIGCYDVVAEKAKHLADKFGVKTFESCEDMVNSAEIDIITVATPSGAHMEPTVAAAKAGKHVICEKPMDVTLERIDAMIEAHQKAGTVLGGIFPYRFNDAMLPLKEVMKSGRFGVITYVGVYVPWWRTEQYYKDSWHGTWKLDGGGALMNQSIHMIDMLCELMPPIEAIGAFTATIGHPQIEAEDTAVVALRFANGALGIIYGTSASYPGRHRRFEITGTKGTVVYLEDSVTTWQFADEKPEDEEIRTKFSRVGTEGGKSDPAAIPYELHRRNFQAFLDALEKGEQFCVNPSEARKTVEIILAIYKAAREQKIVKLDG